MSYRGTPYQPGYGGHASMPMPMPGMQNQSNVTHPYPAARQPTPYPVPVSSVARQPTPYPVPVSSAVARQTSPYPVPVSVATTSEIDNALKQLTDDLINSVITSARNEDLEGLINNDEKLNELIMDSQITKDLNRKREELATFNKDLAITNLSFKPELENLKAKLIELSVRQNELRDYYINNRSKLGNTTSVDTIFAILQAAAAEKETSSDQIKSDFYDSEIGVDEFMKQFIEERKLYQLRKIKSEKMKVLIQNPAVAGYPVNQAGGYQMNQPPPYPAHPTALPVIPHAVPTPHAIPPPRSFYGGYNMR